MKLKILIISISITTANMQNDFLERIKGIIAQESRIPSSINNTLDELDDELRKQKVTPGHIQKLIDNLNNRLYDIYPKIDADLLNTINGMTKIMFLHYSMKTSQLRNF